MALNKILKMHLDNIYIKFEQAFFHLLQSLLDLNAFEDFQILKLSCSCLSSDKELIIKFQQAFSNSSRVCYI